MLPDKIHLTTDTLGRPTRKILPIYLLFVLLTTSAAAYLSYLTRNGFIMGDWLINYQGGFVRRGFIGELIYQLAVALSLDPGLLVFFTQLLFYALFFIFCYLSLSKQKNLNPYLFLIFSPFIFSFQINDILGGFRKEIIAFALLSITAWSSHALTDKSFEKLFTFILVLYPLVILSHEALSILLPYFIIIYLTRLELTKARFIRVGLLVFLSLLSFLACCFYSGTPQHVMAIQQSLEQTGYTVGQGAIDWIGRSVQDSMIDAQNLLFSDTWMVVYVPLLAMAVLAYIPIRSKIVAICTPRFAWSMILVSLIGTIPLLVVTCDYGRLLYYHLVSIFVVTLAVTYDPSETEHSSSLRSQEVAFSKFQVSITILVGIFFLIYSLTWYIPHYNPKWYYLNVPHTTPERYIIIYQILSQTLNSL